ncbi:MAG: CoA pyrophosphatase [Pseudomonadota bacterium]
MSQQHNNSPDLTVDSALREAIAQRLSRFEARSIDANGKKHAAVAIVIVDRQRDTRFADIDFNEADADQAAFVLTIRASKLKTHGGQRAFPGGRMDPGETSLQAALRETREEIGLDLNESSVLGRLDDYATRSGFVMTPYVVWGGRDCEFTANPGEVESIHRIPVTELMREDAPLLDTIPESEHPVLRMPLGRDEWVAAPTGAIAYQFSEVAIQGRHTRVAHFEQPVFAWK